MSSYIEWNLRNFQGYSTPFGFTYNSYLILDEALTLIDTVKHYSFEEFIRRNKSRVEVVERIKEVIRREK
ncbi:MAG TPA: hypothetical protein ENI31_03840 [Candidatus Omnitrophica bacterium]|nr:MAG: hypothetical protein DRP80_04525 [Candidatus Omnitrophota bacterium]HEC69398.1 hypothetical protein [Candidatus Omnitrophota bacterium]